MILEDKLQDSSIGLEMAVGVKKPLTYNFIAKLIDMVATTAVTAPGGVVCVHLEDKVGTSLLRLQLNRDEGGEGGQVRGEAHFVMECAIKALEQGIAARGWPSGHTAMTGQYVSDHVVVKGSRHPNHPDRLKGRVE